MHTDTGRMNESDMAPIPDAEAVFQSAMNELPSDQIIALLMMVSTYREDHPRMKDLENVRIWAERAKKAIDSTTKIEY